MKTAVLKTSSNFSCFEEVLNTFATNGFEDIEIFEELNLTEEEVINKYVELQRKYDFVFPIPPLSPHITNKIMHILANKEED
jgi:hypothetical protein